MGNSKNIWIINEYAGTPYHGMEFRHYYLGKELIKLGHTVSIVTSSYSHLFKKLPDTGKEEIDGIEYLWLRTLNYGDSHNKKRVLKWLIFSLKVFILPLLLKRPDTIIVSPMAPFPIFPAWILSKMYRAKLIYEVKDIWPLTLVEVGGFSKNHLFIRLMSWFEKFALKKSDEIVSNLRNYGEHIKNLGIDRYFHWISNGIDLEELKKIEDLPKAIFEKIPKDSFIIGYTGTVGVANALDTFLDSYQYIEKLSDIYFVIVGDGKEKDRLKEKHKNNKRVLFVESIKKQQIQSMLNLFDTCFIGAKKEKLYKYGVSPNKLFDYMHSGKPILYAIESGDGDIVAISNCGLSVEAENSKAVADAIEKLYKMGREERETLGKNGKKAVLNSFTYAKLAKKFEGVL